MAAGKEEGGPGGKRKRQAEADQNEGEEDAADAGSKRLKHLDDVETSSGQQEDGTQRKRKQVTGSLEDEKAASKSGLTIRWKMGSVASGEKDEPGESEQPEKGGPGEEEAPAEDEANELRSSRSQRHKKQVDSDSQSKRPAAKKDKGKRAGDDQDQSEEAEEGPPVLGPDGEPLEVVPGKEKQVHEGPAVVQQRVQAPHESVEALAAGAGAAVENLSEGQRPVAPPGAEPASIAELGQPGQVTGKQDGPAERLTREVYRVPAHAGWFRWEHIHELERRGVPEFFNGRAPSKTAKTYKEYRDFIISKYREEPRKYLTFTEVRKMLVGDVNALRRVFEFLDHWGLINYQAAADPRQRPPVWEGVSATLVQTPPSGIRVVAPAIAPQDALYKFDAPRAKSTSVATRPGVFPAAAAAASASIAGDAAPPPPAVDYHCDRCGAACSARRYHCQKQADFDLCPDCFANGKFGPGMTSADFIRMDAADAAANAEGGWSDQETLLLLEGLELFGDNWQEIAEHVGTKSRAQCILHFIQMPIEDPFLEELEASSTVTTVTDDPAARGKAADATAAQNGTEAQGPMTASQLVMQASGVGEGEPLTPFADAGNPVMAQVAFLAAMVGPRVAAAAAQAALAALTQEDPTALAGPVSDAAPSTPPAPTTAAATPAPDPPSTDTPKPADQPAAEGDAAPKDAEASGPKNTVMASADGGTPAKEGESGAGAAERKASEGGDVVGKEGAGPGVGGAAESGPAEGAVQTAKDGEKEEGTEVKAEPMEVDKKEAAPVATPAPESTPPAATTPAPGATPPTPGPAPAPGPPSAAQVRAAAATALAAAAVKAKLLADAEEREVARLVQVVVEAQLKKLEIKLKHFDELEEMLEREKDQIEKARQQVYAERVRLAASRLAPTTPRTPAVAGPSAGDKLGQPPPGTKPGGPVNPATALGASPAQ